MPIARVLLVGVAQSKRITETRNAPYSLLPFKSATAANLVWWT